MKELDSFVERLLKNGTIKPEDVDVFVLGFRTACDMFGKAAENLNNEAGKVKNLTIKINKEFEKDIEAYAQEHPKWLDYLSDSTCFELMEWYDAAHNIHTDEDEASSDKAHEFAQYVWCKKLGLEW